MKLATICAQMIIYDDDQYLNLALEPVLKYCDRVLILCNTHPFNVVPGKKYDNSATLLKLQKLAQDEPKIIVESGNWNTEEEERNYGVQRALQLGYTYSLIVDTDEIYDSANLCRLTQILENNEQENMGYHIFHASWSTYWGNNPLYVIEPIESFQPVIVVRNKNAKFVHLRHVVPMMFGKPQLDDRLGRVVLPKDIVTLHHLSYARSDEFIKRKCEESGHSQNGDLMKDWYESVWLKWTPESVNIHPIDPGQYAKAVKVDLTKLPESLQIHFSMIEAGI